MFSPSPNIYQRRLGEGLLGVRCKFNFQSQSPMAQPNTTCNTVPLCRYAKVFRKNFPRNFSPKKGLNQKIFPRFPAFPMSIS